MRTMWSNWWAPGVSAPESTAGVHTSSGVNSFVPQIFPVLPPSTFVLLNFSGVRVVMCFGYLLFRAIKLEGYVFYPSGLFKSSMQFVVWSHSVCLSDEQCSGERCFISLLPGVGFLETQSNHNRHVVTALENPSLGSLESGQLFITEIYKEGLPQNRIYILKNSVFLHV